MSAFPFIDREILGVGRRPIESVIEWVRVVCQSRSLTRCRAERLYLDRQVSQENRHGQKPDGEGRSKQ